MIGAGAGKNVRKKIVSAREAKYESYKFGIVNRVSWSFSSVSWEYLGDIGVLFRWSINIKGIKGICVVVVESFV